MRHGYSISSIAIVAVVGVALVLAWMNYNSSAGINYANRISDDKSNFKASMETVKEVAAPALKHAANDAALAVAESGGGIGTERIWFCGGDKPIPPTLHEVVYALSNKTLTNFNKYLDDATEIYSTLGIETTPYTCTEHRPLLSPSCPPNDYPLPCDGWNVTATGGSIYAIEDEITHTYVGDVKTELESDRFFWMYYRLLEAEAENTMLADIKAKYENKYEHLVCYNETNVTVIDPITQEETITTTITEIPCCVTTQNFTAIANGILNLGEAKFNTHFDQYVKCEVTTECQQVFSIAIRIECTDTKYKIPAENETGERYMKWVLKEMIAVSCGDNLAICTGEGNAPGPPLPPPPASMSSYKSADVKGDLFFAMSNSQCNELQECFDVSVCPTGPFDKKLCFNP